jgi:hypothetical protein
MVCSTPCGEPLRGQRNKKSYSDLADSQLILFEVVEFRLLWFIFKREAQGGLAQDMLLG